MIEEINKKELPFKSWISMGWSLLWRNILIAIGAYICAYLVADIIDFLGKLIEISIVPLKISRGIISLVFGFFSSIILLKWFFKTKFKNFRIAILKHSGMIEEINKKELPFKSWISMAWALLWRQLITVIGASICSILIFSIYTIFIGFVIAFLENLNEIKIKIPMLEIQIMEIISSSVVGLFFQVIHLKWFFKTKFKGFRIAILKQS